MSAIAAEATGAMPKLPIILLSLAMLPSLAPAAARETFFVCPQETIEYSALSCKVAVRGKVVLLRRESSDACARDIVQISVTEVLKGPAQTEVEFVTQSRVGLKVGDDVLAFLRTNSDRDSPRWLCRTPILLDGKTPQFLMSYEPVTEPARLLQAAREVLAEGQENAAGWLAPMPESTVPRNWPRPHWLHLPHIPALETHARRWCRADAPDVRKLGVRAISKYKSPANIELLKSMLGDTGIIGSAGVGKWKRGAYEVREEAFSILRSWDVTVPKPEFSGPMLSYRPAAFTLVGAMTVLAIVGAITGIGAGASIAARRRLGLHPSISAAVGAALAALSLSLAILAAVVWQRSHSTVDEVTFNTGSSHHELSSYRGGMQYMLVNNWSRSHPLLLGVFHTQQTEDAWSLQSLNPDSHHGLAGFHVAKGQIDGPFDVDPTSQMKGAVPLLPYSLLRAPWWFLIAMVLILPVRRSAGFLRRRHWLKTNHCTNCGYDLRATPDLCPECGQRRAQAPTPVWHHQSLVPPRPRSRAAAGAA